MNIKYLIVFIFTALKVCFTALKVCFTALKYFSTAQLHKKTRKVAVCAVVVQ